MNFNILISRAPLRSQAHQGISLFTSTVRRIKGAVQRYRPTADFHILAINFGPKFHLSLLQHGRGGCNVSSFCKLLKTFLFDRNRTVMLCYVMLCYVMLYGYLQSASHRRLFRGALSVTGW